MGGVDPYATVANVRCPAGRQSLGARRQSVCLVALAVLTRGFLVIVGAEGFSSTEITELSDRGHATGRLSVDVAVDPPVDQPQILHAIVQRQPRLPT